MKVQKKCACGAEISVEMPSAAATNHTTHHETAWREREDMKKQIASWDREHKGHTGLGRPASIVHTYVPGMAGTNRPLPPPPETTC